MRSYVATGLEDAGVLDVVQVPSGFAALRALPGGHFDLVITDVNMPDINGLELINFIKTNPAYCDTPLFIVSTESSAADRERGLALGACEYLVKPFDPEALIKKVRAHLGCDEGA